ncbi:serine/threonine-protein kinase [Kitasatospora sp. NPDC002227]|uniref:serine/threonine-protein kinase n=1 Tax=Kitasatospora sp. NPDC002227 TaxID=3154773 RepID=UPI00332097FF
MYEPRPTPTPAFQPLNETDPVELGGYRLIARLGAGGMGRVYLSYTPGGRPVALKVVRPELAEDPEFRRRFAQEVASARLIHGLYTAQVVDAGPDDPLPWLATAYVPGPSLHHVVRGGGPLPEHTVLLLLAGIAEALQVIHAAGVVHRDLKPANVLLAADGPRVIDFGIARAADGGALTGTGLRIGSPGFMAPEQAVGAPATPATDVFALGALAAWTATGRSPFGGGPDSGALYRVVHEEPDLAAVPPGLDGIVRACLAKRPEDRPTTAQLIEAVHRHPALGGQLRFTDGWLPQHVSAELSSRADLPQTPAAAYPDPAAPTAYLGGQPPQAAPYQPTRYVETALHEAATEAGPTPQHTPPPTPTRRRAGRRGAAVAALVVLALLAGAGATYYLLPDGSDAADDSQDVADTPADSEPADTPSASPTAPTAPTAPGYTTVYTGRELVSPDRGYEFDLKTGTVTPAEAADWYVARSAAEFLLPDTTDAYLGPDARLAPADCLHGLESGPTTKLDFPTVTGRSFCVRSQDGHDLAVLRLLSTPQGDGPLKVSVDYFRRDAG